MKIDNILFNIFKLHKTQPIIFVCMLYLLYFFPEHIINTIKFDNNFFLNFITSINLLTVISLLGMSLTCFPLLFVICDCYKERLVIAIFILSLLAIPLILILEFLGYIISYVMIVKSLDYPENIGICITIGAMLIFYGLLLLSTKLNSNIDVNNRMIHINLHFFIASATMVLTLQYNSIFFASVTIIAFRLAMMNNVLCYKLCDIFTFKNKYILQRLTIVSLLTLLLFLLMSIIRLNILAVFMQPMYISSTLVYMSMLLIISSKFYEYDQRIYFNTQIMTMISILTFGLIGFLNIAFLYIALIFLVLYLTEKSFEMWYEYDHGVFLVFNIFVMLYLISRFVVFDINFLVSVFIF